MKQRQRYLYLWRGAFYYDFHGDASRNDDHADAVKVHVKWERGWTGRFDWECPTCGAWHRYYETECTEEAQP